MYKAIQSQRKIADAQKKLLNEIREALPAVEGVFTIGHQGDNFELNNLHSNGLIWFGHFKDFDAEVPRFWNGFGLTEELVHTGSNKIVAEANVALDGNHPRAKSVAALFAEDETGNVVLIHTGKIGGGKKGVGKSTFLTWYKGKKCEFLHASDLEAPEHGIIVADLGRRNTAETIGAFVHSVALFKAGTSLSNITDLSDAELEKKAKAARRQPKAKTSATIIYSRNQYVARYAKKRANGRCDLCKADAPFIDAIGEPYLECHHIVWLAHNGPDSIDNTVALCPNCHRRMHILRDINDVKNLQKRAARQL